MNYHKKIGMADDAAKLRMRNRRLPMPAVVAATDELKKLVDFLGAKTVPVRVREISEYDLAGI